MSPRDQVIEFLNAHTKMGLSTSDEEGRPDSSLVLYVIDDDLRFYVGTRKSWGTYKALKSNPEVAILVQEEGADPKRVVDALGVAEEIEAEELLQKKAMFQMKNPAENFAINEEDYTMFVIRPTRLTWLDGSSGKLEREELIPELASVTEEVPLAAVEEYVEAKELEEEKTEAAEERLEEIEEKVEEAAEEGENIPIPPSRLRKLLVQTIGVIFIFIGIIGIFLPFLQGLLFLIAGFLLLSVYNPALKERINRILSRHPALVKLGEVAERLIIKIFGDPNKH